MFPIAKAYRRQKFPLAWLGLAPQITEKDLREWEELLFDTARCAGAATVCPMGIDIASIVSGARQAFVAAGLGPKNLLAAADSSRDHGSPLGLTADKLRERIEWLEDEHEVKIVLDKDKADILLTVSSIEAMKYPKSIVAMAKLLNHAGVNWTLSTKGYEATNFGYLAGKGDIAKLMVQRITDAAESVGAKTVIIPECGHAFGVLRWAGANMLGRPLPYAVMHISEFMAQLKREGKLKLKPLEGIDHLSRPLSEFPPWRRNRGCTLFASGFRKGFPGNDANRKLKLVLRWRGRVQAIARAADLRHKVFKIKMDQVEQTGAKTRYHRVPTAASPWTKARRTGSGREDWQVSSRSLPITWWKTRRPPKASPETPAKIIGVICSSMRDVHFSSLAVSHWVCCTRTIRF